jgi:hypothetical protein
VYDAGSGVAAAMSIDGPGERRYDKYETPSRPAQRVASPIGSQGRYRDRSIQPPPPPSLDNNFRRSQDLTQTRRKDAGVFLNALNRERERDDSRDYERERRPSSRGQITPRQSEEFFEAPLRGNTSSAQSAEERKRLESLERELEKERSYGIRNAIAEIKRDLQIEQNARRTLEQQLTETRQALRDERDKTLNVKARLGDDLKNVSERLHELELKARVEFRGQRDDRKEVESKVARLDAEHFNAVDEIRRVEEENNRLARKYAVLKEQVARLIDNQRALPEEFMGKDKEQNIGRMERDVSVVEEKLGQLAIGHAKVVAHLEDDHATKLIAEKTDQISKQVEARLGQVNQVLQRMERAQIEGQNSLRKDLEERACTAEAKLAYHTEFLTSLKNTIKISAEELTNTVALVAKNDKTAIAEVQMALERHVDNQAQLMQRHEAALLKQRQILNAKAEADVIATLATSESVKMLEQMLRAEVSSG